MPKKATSSSQKEVTEKPRAVPEVVAVSAPNIQRAEFRIRGTAPYMQNRFSKKAQDAMHEKHEAGSTAKKGKKREARDFQADFKEAAHVSKDGWYGVPASAFRNAMISACRLVNFKMTLAKLSLFVFADGYDVVDDSPLVKIEGEPEYSEMPVVNANGSIDLRARPIWHEWSARIRLRYDADQFTATDVANLLMRVGEQVGIGAGRADSKNSPGIGFGFFAVE